MRKRGFISDALIFLVIILTLYWVMPMLLNVVGGLDFSGFNFSTDPVKFVLYASVFGIFFAAVGGGLLAVLNSLQAGQIR